MNKVNSLGSIFATIDNAEKWSEVVVVIYRLIVDITLNHPILSAV